MYSVIMLLALEYIRRILLEVKFCSLCIQGTKYFFSLSWLWSSTVKEKGGGGGGAVTLSRGHNLENFWEEGLVSKETVVFCRWGVETNVWFINRVDN